MADISVIGPLARSVRDLQSAFGVILGPDPADSDLQYVLPQPRTTEIRGLRVAVWSQQAGQATDQETIELIEQLGGFLAAQGATVSFAARPAIDPVEAFHTFLSLLDAALNGRMPPAMLAQRRAARDLLATDDLSANAVMLRATGMEHATWLALNERRYRMRLVWSAFFRDWDVLLCPVIATPALRHQREGDMASRTLTVDDTETAYGDQLFWSGITCGFHLPATVAPIGLSRTGLPIGVQIAGPVYGDLTTMAVAAMLEQNWRPFQAPPFDAAPPN